MCTVNNSKFVYGFTSSASTDSGLTIVAVANAIQFYFILNTLHTPQTIDSD